MKKIVIIGNSASGKSTLAKSFASFEHVAHLDLDTIAWEKGTPPTRLSIEQSKTILLEFDKANKSWVIEGCYGDLVQCVVPYANEMIFLDLPVETCINNARSRLWEAHKYDSQAEQDRNLDMLIQWIAAYPERTGPCSRSAHRALFNNFKGKKTLRQSFA